MLADRSRIFFCAPCSLLAARGPAIKKLKIKSTNMFTKTKKNFGSAVQHEGIGVINLVFFYKAETYVSLIKQFT